MTTDTHTLHIEEILELLPHRYPFLLVDRVLDFEEGRFLRAVKNVSVNEPFFQGHFPKYPVMPGVLILEALAQAAGLLTFKSVGTPPSDNTMLFYAGIDNARFRRQVVPGDVLTLHAEITANKRGIWKYSAKAMVGDEIAAEAELMCTLRQVDPVKVELPDGAPEGGPQGSSQNQADARNAISLHINFLSLNLPVFPPCRTSRSGYPPEPRSFSSRLRT